MTGPSPGAPGAGAVVIDLVAASAVDADGPGGAVWSLPHGGELDANVVRLDPGTVVGRHVNDDVDVLMVVRSGAGELVVDGARYALGRDVLVLVPRGASREVRVGPAGIVYLSIHRRRGSLTIGRRR